MKSLANHKRGAQQDLSRTSNEPETKNGQVTASSRRFYATKSSNCVNPGGGQVDAGTDRQPGYIQPNWDGERIR
jgi:hypothetical protein